jgi:hypothetical protein
MVSGIGFSYSLAYNYFNKLPEDTRPPFHHFFCQTTAEEG